MPDLAGIEAQIRERLAVLEELMDPLRREIDELTRMAAAFASSNTDVASPRARRSGRSDSAPRPTRAPGVAASSPADRTASLLAAGTRAHQAVTTIVERPGITAAELAEAMGIRANYLYRILPRLQRAAVVTKRGMGYHAAAETETPE